MCTYRVISHLYGDKLDGAERGERALGGGGPGGASGRDPPPPPPLPGSGVEPLSGGLSAARPGTIKCNFTAAPQGGKEHFFCLFQIK